MSGSQHANINAPSSSSSSMGSGPQSLRQQLRQRRELEDLRKFGLAPLARDAVTGQEISPNLPVGLSQAPWYYGMEGQTLEHHRLRAADPDAQLRLRDSGLETVVIVEKQAHFVPGACENCGSTTHKTKACLMPKRKAGAAATGVVEGVDQTVAIVSAATGEAASHATASFSQKRDRWAGTNSVDDVWNAYEKRERSGEEGELKHEGRKRTEAIELPSVFAATKGDSVSSEIKSLPKYLENIESGAFYDPVTRSMRGNPHERGSIESAFRGENARLADGGGYRDALELQRRFLSGASTCLVDFEFDAKVAARRQEEEAAHRVNGGDDVVVPAAASSQLPQSENEALITEVLYGGGSQRIALPLASAELQAPAGSGEAAPPVAPVRVVATAGGHANVFGSYFDPETLRWGYKCCRETTLGTQCSCTKHTLH